MISHGEKVDQRFEKLIKADLITVISLSVDATKIIKKSNSHWNFVGYDLMKTAIACKQRRTLKRKIFNRVVKITTFFFFFLITTSSERKQGFLD